MGSQTHAGYERRARLGDTNPLDTQVDNDRLALCRCVSLMSMCVDQGVGGINCGLRLGVCRTKNGVLSLITGPFTSNITLMVKGWQYWLIREFCCSVILGYQLPPSRVSQTNNSHVNNTFNSIGFAWLFVSQCYIAMFSDIASNSMCHITLHVDGLRW